jgi:hypothetical protein
MAAMLPGNPTTRLMQPCVPRNKAVFGIITQFFLQIGLVRLDLTAFNTCFQSDRYANFINQDLFTGQTAGVSGTPSVFVNGQIVTPGFIPSYDQLAAAIDFALAGK